MAQEDTGQLEKAERLGEIAQLYGQLVAVDAIITGFGNAMNFQQLRTNFGIAMAEEHAVEIMKERHDISIAVARLKDRLFEITREIENDKA